MADWTILLHTGITIAGIIALIAGARLNPVIVLVLGALYLGVAGGLGFEATTSAVAEGFGALMAEVGLVIGFGVLLGSLLSAMGTLQRVVELMLRLVGAKRSSYALGLSSGIVFPSIYFDVALVMLAPIARSIAARTGRSVAPLAGSLAIGLEVGLLMVLPGAAAVAVAGSLNIPLGTMLLWGIPFAIVSIVVSVYLHSLLMSRSWNPDKDVDPFAEFDDNGGRGESTDGEGDRGPGPSGGPLEPSGGNIATLVRTRGTQQPLIVAVLPVLVPLLLIVVDTISSAVAGEIAVVSFLGNPVVALLLGLLIAIALALPTLGRTGVEKVIAHGAGTSGVILLFTGVAGSLGQVISKTGVGDMLASLFSTSTAIPLLLTWAVGALLRLAQGSGSVAAITAASLLAPVVGDLGMATVLIGLAAAAGACFGGQVSDNTFWMFKTLLGLTTRGAFQVYTVAQSILSFVALAMVMALGAVV